MAVRMIVTGGNSVLREKAKPVEVINSTVLALLEDMVETMFAAQGIGLAAPQIGISKQLIVVDAGESKVLQLINPRIVEAEGRSVDVEGCLSIPGIYGEVDRAEKVTVTALEKDGNEVRLQAEGLLSRILQHEIDHLHGTLFVDRASHLLDPDTAKRSAQEGRS